MLTIALRRAVIGVFLTAGIASAQDAESLFQDGIDAYRTGDAAAAVELFKDALALNPSNEDVFRLWHEAEQQVILDMLLARGEMGDLAQRFLQLAKVGRVSVTTDPGGAVEAVQNYLTGDALASQRALLTLQATYGEWAVPALVAPLGDRANADNRVMALKALIHLGDLAVPALVAVLNSDDETTRTNAAAALGTIGDVRAAAGLAWMASTDDSSVAALVAGEAVTKLAGALSDLGLHSTDALEITRGLVEGWISGDPRLSRPYTSGQVAWTWDDNGLSGVPILGGLHGLVLAKSAIDSASLALTGVDDTTNAGMAAVAACMKAEILSAAELDGLGDDGLMEAALGWLPAIELDLALSGYARGVALEVLLAHDQVASARVLMDVMGVGAEEIEALRAALGSRHEGVATHAALTLGRLGIEDSRAGDLLASALVSVPARLAFAIGDTGLSANASGWELLTSTDVASGLLRAKAFPPKDVIVVRDGAGGVTLDTLIFGLRNDARTAETPIVVVTDAASFDTVSGRYADSVSAVVAGAAGWEHVMEVAGDLSALRQAAVARAVAAAEALAQLGTGGAAVGERASEVLAAGGDDSVTVAVLNLVTRRELNQAVNAVEALLVSGGLSDDVQAAALRAAERLWARSGGSFGDVVALHAALQELLDGGDADMAVAAARALGQLGAGSGSAG